MILAKTAVTMVPPTNIGGNSAIYPNTRAAMTGVTFTQDPGLTFSTSVQVDGRAFAANDAMPTPARWWQT